ncbi:MAG: deoxyribose-phosphate aldolase [Firmicutes bacterium]|nr:deoxyribose-phosphate aldolase [Bacillota bacterium]
MAPPGAETDEAPCTDCDQRCIERCTRRAKQVVAAGADRLSASAPIGAVEADLAPLIDHTLLKPEATRDDIERLCQEALRFGFASVVVNPWYVPLAAERVRGSRVRVCTVVGFPLGATLPQVKLYETEQVLKLGAEEVDMVLNLGALKSGQDEVVESDIRSVVEACHRGGATCKVILETALLTLEEKVRACLASKHAGADFVKTSTGFGPGGATAEDVALMRCVVGPEMGVKAAGGIRSLEELRRMVAAGATRIGASASVRILEEARTGTVDRPVQAGRPAAGSAPSGRIPY